MERRALGRWGEQVAAAYLLVRGYRIVRRGWRAGRRGEIDLVARRGDVLAFIEVKTRSGRSRGDAVAAVGASKQRRLVHLAEAFLGSLPAGSPLRSLRCRMDVVTVERGRFGWCVRHLPGAFDGSERGRRPS